jgi:glycosyltransferase involved in cell wall biosynthesis
VVEDNVSGLLVPTDNPDDLARAIGSLIQDPKRRMEMGQAAKRRARERFSAEVIVPRYEALYRRVCN